MLAGDRGGFRVIRRRVVKSRFSFGMQFGNEIRRVVVTLSGGWGGEVEDG